VSSEVFWETGEVVSAMPQSTESSRNHRVVTVEGGRTNMFASLDFLLNFLIEKSLIAALPSSPAFFLKALKEKRILRWRLLNSGKPFQMKSRQ
jgi:hypothetical protein